jgi:hypothetical protein
MKFQCFALASLIVSFVSADEPNPPVWPNSVKIFNPSQSTAVIEEAVNAAFATNGGHNPPNNGQFSTKRFAFLFKPGSYGAEVPVGFYTQVMGLGETPGQVIFTSEKGVYCEEGDYGYTGGALDTFWRSAENFRTQATWKNTAGPGMLWAVSQAAPLRRIQVDNALTLYEYQPPYQGAGYSSGGFFANLEVGFGEAGDAKTKDLKKQQQNLRSQPNRENETDNGPAVNLGSQQQWFARNSKVSAWNGGVWNVVVCGVDGAPASHCSNQGGIPITNIPETPLISEKPYITVDSSGEKFNLVVPALKTNSHGFDFDSAVDSTIIGFEKVYVTKPTDTATDINSKLKEGLHIVLSPAIYNLDAALEIAHENQVILGLGMPTLRPTNATAIIKVGNVDGARICGVIVQAGPVVDNRISPALIQFGQEGQSYAGSATNPSFMHDVFARVGGPDGTPDDPVGADVMVRVDNGFVIGDNMWFWRADHTVAGGADLENNKAMNGLVVTGDDVIMYGLAVEHALEDLVQWSGERGQTYFFQSELPYSVDHTYGDNGFAGFRVNESVKNHDGYGIGVYSNFVKDSVNVQSAIVVPNGLESRFVAPVTVFLNGKGSIQHIVNEQGAAVQNNSRTSYNCNSEQHLASDN